MMFAMTISADEAADVAARHGLALADAQALAVLADDVGHADRLAAQFAPTEAQMDTALRVAGKRSAADRRKNVEERVMRQ